MFLNRSLFSKFVGGLDDTLNNKLDCLKRSGASLDLRNYWNKMIKNT